MPKLDPARLHVIRPGLLTTIQDLGRAGYQRFGMPVSGAMDVVAHRIANRLVGNPDHYAGLEMTLQGPELLFETDAVIAVTGGDLSPLVERQIIPLWTAMSIARGSTLSFGKRKTGARAYMAIAGGLDVPEVLGSRSTHVRSHTGGLDGRALTKNDLLQGGRPSARWTPWVGPRRDPVIVPAYPTHPTLRVVLGPQADWFSKQTLNDFTKHRYRVSPQSDRMGYRLVGPPLPHIGSPDIISDAIPFGSLQVPANQQPILLMADRQTTGGYPKIGVVISADLPLAAQLLPGDTLGFSFVDRATAQAAARAQRSALDAVLPPVA